MHFTNALLVSSTLVASISALSLPRLGGLQKRDDSEYGYDILPSKEPSKATSSPVLYMSKPSQLPSVSPMGKPPMGTGYPNHGPPYGTGSGRPHRPYPTGTGAPYPIKGNHTIHPSGSGHHSGRPHSTGHHSGRPHSTGHMSYGYHTKSTGDKTTTRRVKSTKVNTSVVGVSPTTSVDAAGSTTTTKPYGIKSVAPNSSSGSADATGADATGTTTDAPTGISAGNCPVVTPKTVTSTLVSTVTVTAGPKSDQTAPTGGQGGSTRKTIKSTKTRTNTKKVRPTGGMGGYWNGTGNGTYGRPSGSGQHSGSGRPTHKPIGTGMLSSTGTARVSIDHGSSTALPVKTMGAITSSAKPTTMAGGYGDY